MANQTITVDTNMTVVIAAGLLNGENITINSGAVLTVDQSPTVLIGQININDGEMLLDGANAANPIVFVGEQAEEININGAGTLRSSLGWWEFPTLGDGTANQTFDCTTYFSSSGSGITSDVFPGVWVETGRRINYDGGVGIPPVVGDWVFAVADQTIHGRITEVSGDGVTGYIVVRFLTGALADNDAIELHTIQDNGGPDYQKSWTANANGVDVLEAGVFQEFGNAYQNSTDLLPSMGSGIAGFGFSQPYQNNTLTFGDGTSGFIVPNGARVRVPMVHVATSTIALYTTGATGWETNSSAMYEIETVNGGDCFLNGLMLGSTQWDDVLGGIFESRFCASTINLGVSGALGRAVYENCIFSCSPIGVVTPASRSTPPVVDMLAGAEIRDCLNLSMVNSGAVTEFGGQTSNDVIMERCIQISNAFNMEMEFARVSNFTVHDLVVIGTQLVMTTAVNGSITLLKTQKKLNASVDGRDQVAITGNCNNIKIVGWEILNGSAPNDSKIFITDSNNIKVRCFHFMDDPFDNEGKVGTQGREFASITGFTSDIDIARCWIDRGSPNEFIYQIPGTVKNVTVRNCGGEYTGEIEPDGINTSYRGLRGGSGSLGGSTGLETDYPGTTGAHFGDIFESDTAGYIYYRNVPGNIEYPITILSGAPKFTKDGDVDVQLGDQWEVDMGYVCLGHVSFTGVITTARGGGVHADGADTWTGVDIDFQYDTGSGYNGAWLDLRTALNLTSIVGMVDGIRLKLRFTANSAQTNGQALTIHTTTTLADQAANMHPIDQNTVEVTVTVFDASSLTVVENARVYVIAAAGGPLTPGTIIMSVLSDVNGKVSIPEYAYLSDQPIEGHVRKGSVSPLYKTTLILGTITDTGFTTSTFLVRDE